MASPKAKLPICGICKKSITDGNIHADHIIPRSFDGPKRSWNLRLTHRYCNLRRQNHIEPFQMPLEAIGFLIQDGKNRMTPTIAELTQLLGISFSTLYRYIDRGMLPPIRRQDFIGDILNYPEWLKTTQVLLPTLKKQEPCYRRYPGLRESRYDGSDKQ